MGTVIFKCQKCGADLEAEQELSGTFIDCPQCKTTVDIPFKKMIVKKKDVVSVETPMPPSPAVVVPLKPTPPYPGWSIILNSIGGICLFSAFFSLMDKGVTASFAFLSGISLFTFAYLLKVLCDIRWYVRKVKISDIQT